MSVVLQVGQAGNQIGDELWRVLGAERKRQRRSNDLFSDQPDGSFRANCVMIDAESRGLGGLRKQPWISRDNVVTDPKNTGRGNNWACGYARADSAEPAQFRWRRCIRCGSSATAGIRQGAAVWQPHAQSQPRFCAGQCSTRRAATAAADGQCTTASLYEGFIRAEGIGDCLLRLGL